MEYDKVECETNRDALNGNISHYIWNISHLCEDILFERKQWDYVDFLEKSDSSPDLVFDG